MVLWQIKGIALYELLNTLPHEVRQYKVLPRCTRYAERGYHSHEGKVSLSQPGLFCESQRSILALIIDKDIRLIKLESFIVHVRTQILHRHPCRGA